MKSPSITLFFSLLCAACQFPNQASDTPTAIKTVIRSEKREVDQSPVWQIREWGGVVYFPSHKGFSFHSIRKTSDKVTVAWEGVDENLKPTNQEFNASSYWVGRNGLMVRIDRFASRGAKDDATRCDGSYQTKELVVSKGGRMATVNHCARLKGANLQEVSVRLHVTQPLVFYSAHWFETLPISKSFDFADPKWQERADSMGDVVFCDDSVIPKWWREKCQMLAATTAAHEVKEYAK